MKVSGKVLHCYVSIFVCIQLQKTVWLIVLISMKKESSAHSLAAVPLPSPRSPAYSAFLLNKCSLVAIVPSIDYWKVRSTLMIKTLQNKYSLNLRPR